MKRHVQVAVFALMAVAPLLAQQAPKGWKMRVDQSKEASDPDANGSIKFVTMGTGFHATNPQAAVYWNPMHKVTGNYTLKGTFTLMKPSGHTNYYGLVFGGTDLDGPKQQYMYFMVAQNGTWLVKMRDGESTSTIAGKSPSEAVKKPDDTGKSTNALEVRVSAAKIDFVVNGTVVNSTPKMGTADHTNGIYGIRVNHLLEVHIDGFGLSK